MGLPHKVGLKDDFEIWAKCSFLYVPAALMITTLSEELTYSLAVH